MDDQEVSDWEALLNDVERDLGDAEAILTDLEDTEALRLLYQSAVEDGSIHSRPALQKSADILGFS